MEAKSGHASLILVFTLCTIELVNRGSYDGAPPFTSEKMADNMTLIFKNEDVFIHYVGVIFPKRSRQTFLGKINEIKGSDVLCF